MSDGDSRIDVHINLNDSPVSIERLNRSIRNLPASFTDLDVSQAADPEELTDYRADGIVTGAPDTDTDIPNELWVVGRVVVVISRDTPCQVQETAVDSGDMERSFTLYGHFKQ